MCEFQDKDPIAKAYDDTDDEHIANLYTMEAVAEMEDAWWIRVERCDDG